MNSKMATVAANLWPVCCSATVYSLGWTWAKDWLCSFMNGLLPLGHNLSCVKVTVQFIWTLTSQFIVFCLLVFVVQKLHTEFPLQALNCWQWPFLVLSWKVLWQTEVEIFFTFLDFLFSTQTLLLSLRNIEFLCQQLPRAVQSSRGGAGWDRRSQDLRCWIELCQIHLWHTGTVNDQFTAQSAD